MRYAYQRMNKQEKANAQNGGDQVAKKYQIIKLGLDVHADSIRVVRIIDEAAPQPAQRFSEEGLLVWVQRQKTLAQEVYSCYEAGPFGYGLHRKLESLGVKNKVVRPQVLNEYGNGVNTDATDALALAQRLDRYVRGNHKALGVVRVPSPEEEQKRIASRQREQLKREQKRLAAQGRSLLLSQGWREKGPWWKPARWESLKQRLPEWLIPRMEVFLCLLAVVQKQLDQATRALEACAPSVRPRGLGGLTYETIFREIGYWPRFHNRKQVGSYSGLCAGVSSSGAMVRMLSITKHGNVRLRAQLIELAWRMVKWQPQCRAVQRWRHVLLAPKISAGARKKAIVAVARQLVIDLWRWQTGRATPETLGWIMTS